MSEKKANGEGEGIEGENFRGNINPKKMTADFPATMDTLGKVQVPMYVRNRLGLKHKAAEMQVAISVKEVLE